MSDFIYGVIDWMDGKPLRMFFVAAVCTAYLAVMFVIVSLLVRVFQSMLSDLTVLWQQPIAQVPFGVVMTTIFLIMVITVSIYSRR